ncbi:MAG: M15 family metallopeptidase [Ignavibacteriaceae bacterium]|nr:M15 family metallopeptidase [Ignavibacteriaceae bacterium]
MKIKIIPLLIIFLYSIICFGQSVNKYGLTIIDDTSFYRKEVERDSLNKFVDLEKFIPGIKLDIKYATKNNFVGVPVYTEAKAFLRLPAAYALKKVQAELKKRGLGLKVYDAYRPYSVTVLFYDKIRDTDFVASPWEGSRHNRGCAVDVSIINLKTGKELEMPTKIDDFTFKAHPDYKDIPDTVKSNRTLLFNVMKKYGFSQFPTEWWHFDFSGWINYFLMDLKFEDLE